VHVNLVFTVDSPWWVLGILFLPLLAFVIQIFAGRFLWRKGDWVSTGAVWLSLVMSLALFMHVLNVRTRPGGFLPHVYSWEWIMMPGLGEAFAVRLGILVDGITAIMLVVVTVVSLLVHLYSIGYMKGDPGYPRFYACLSLFTFSMLGLVLCSNLLLLYIFWELVGVMSYLLIGFWFEKPAAAAASKKAFLTTRIGDAGFLVGIMLIFGALGTFDYFEVFKGIANGQMQGALLTAAGVCLFLGAVGKSAQFPLHVWLPDAMEGPTPVSALIHAATMVAAGVYMVTRLFVVFTPDALTVIAYTGGFTAVLAAYIAITQNDIKRVLAYSTISQLGFMMMGLGAGVYVYGFFHLWTHAFFKALLFLCAGSVIHAMHTNDMREMGGLRHKMPLTFVPMLVGTLALAGCPFLSGYFSKDGILEGVLERGFADRAFLPLALFGFVAAGMTAFYMFRLIFMTFTGMPRNVERFKRAQESPMSMVFPLVVLAGLAAFSGGLVTEAKWFGEVVKKPGLAAFKKGVETMNWKPGMPVPVHVGKPKVDEAYEGFADKRPKAAAPEEHGPLPRWIVFSLPIFVALCGALLAVAMYSKHRRIDPDAVASRFKLLYALSLNKFYMDELYSACVVRPVMRLAEMLGKADLNVIDGIVNGMSRFTVGVAEYCGWADKTYVDGAVNGVAETVTVTGSMLNKVQTGRIRVYAAWAVCGVVLLTALYGIAVNYDHLHACVMKLYQ
jgi:NADH-quinone oxidoreductase subunit L